MIPNPWILLGAACLWISTALGIWAYRGHVDATACKAQVETMIAAQNAAANASLLKAAADTKAMSTKQQGVVNDLEKQIQRTAVALADERDSSERLRSAVAIYSASAGPAGSSGLPLPEVQRRLSTLAQLYGELVSAGETTSTAADDANTKRIACERWSLIVKPD